MISCAILVSLTFSVVCVTLSNWQSKISVKNWFRDTGFGSSHACVCSQSCARMWTHIIYRVAVWILFKSFMSCIVSNALRLSCLSVVFKFSFKTGVTLATGWLGKVYNLCQQPTVYFGSTPDSSQTWQNVFHETAFQEEKNLGFRFCQHFLV